MTTPPPPGWYQDPETPGRERWWTGVAWGPQRDVTPNVAPAVASAPVYLGEPFTGAAPAPQKKRGWCVVVGIVVVVVIVWAIVAGANASRSEAEKTSAACRTAVVTALQEERALYANHPLHNTEIPGLDASADERANYDALQADEEAQWTAIYAPIYSTCESPADWWAAAKEYPGIAGVTDADALTPESLKNWCTGSETQPACIGIDEWLATDPK
ncbi:DUF2510 domain-containing protein [Microbacterium sp. A196]|uniref:DUF2510 domain-containing protein n=1 Tax=Microbacterium sp. A196 TaxID=3457320 RepID=UPI003FD49125